ncbi:cation transport ATPase [Salinibacter ruber]|nr:cation transport ATPase [Salinibacter ruber]
MTCSPNQPRHGLGSRSFHRCRRCLVDDRRGQTPGMMMLVAFASAVAYAYSAAVALAVPEQMVF